MSAEYWRRGLILQRLVKARIKGIAVIMKNRQPSKPIKIQSARAGKLYLVLSAEKINPANQSKLKVNKQLRPVQGKEKL